MELDGKFGDKMNYVVYDWEFDINRLCEDCGKSSSNEDKQTMYKNMTNQNQIRQGDILLLKVNKIEGQKIANGKRVLAYGEKTGHSHVMIGNVDYYDNGNGLLCQVKSHAELMHEEHQKIDIPSGNYMVVRQREFDIVEGIRRVQD